MIHMHSARADPFLVSFIKIVLCCLQYMGKANAMGGPANLWMNLFCYSTVLAVFRVHPSVAIKVLFFYSCFSPTNDEDPRLLFGGYGRAHFATGPFCQA